MHQNFELLKRLEDLLNANGDLKLRLREAETRGIIVPQVRDRPNYSGTIWSPHGSTWADPEERRSNLLRPNPRN